MSLLQNEDFLIWQLRTSYLTHNKDGVGERLITLDNTAIFSDPALRAAGYGADIDNYRTYSPPIPTATAVASDYFSAPSRSKDYTSVSSGDVEEDEGGLATGRGSTDTVGPAPHAKRRRRREREEEEDSSDLSDESDEEGDSAQRAAQRISFAKMPVRTRAGSSPLRRSPPLRRSSIQGGPEVLAVSPSKLDARGRLRRGSLGTVETIKQRSRTDTTTSSELSSDNELDPSLFRRRTIRPARPRKNSFLQGQYEGDEEQDELERLDEEKEDAIEADLEGSSLSSGFAETADSESLLDGEDSLLPASLAQLMPAGLEKIPSSPRKTKAPPPQALSQLPPPRPISTVQPVSALGQAIRARKAKPKNPVEPFGRFSGKGALDPLNIKIYAPFSDSSSRPFDMPLQKAVQDHDSGALVSVTVADAIGLSLLRYHEECLRPPIAREKLDINRWTLRIVDDGEVEYDFPALNRVSNIVDFTSNNNRPARGRGRGKAFDEFALVGATESQYIENRKLTPRYTALFEHFNAPLEMGAAPGLQAEESAISEEGAPLTTNIRKQFAASGRKGSAGLADRQAVPFNNSTPRSGPPKMLQVHFTSLEAHSQTHTLEVTTDTYFAEVLDQVCKRWNLDKSHHFLRVSGSSTTAPLDRTVEAIGTRTSLDLVRRRFAHDPSIGLGSSPSSSTPPNAPLAVDPVPATPARKGRKGPNALAGGVHPLAQQEDAWGNTANYKKFTVVRKQPMSFTPSHTRTLLMDGDCMHILPGESGKTLFDNAGGTKTTTIPFSLIVGSKVSRRHPKVFRVLVFRERETKRYDFEAGSAAEAAEIVGEISEKIKPFLASGESKFALQT